jgi:hypothetical protein
VLATWTLDEAAITAPLPSPAVTLPLPVDETESEQPASVEAEAGCGLAWLIAEAQLPDGLDQIRNRIFVILPRDAAAPDDRRS